MTKSKSEKYEPQYININGHVYEKLCDSVDVELELADDVLSKIDSLVETGQFVSRGDAIRSILRDAIREKTK